MERQASDKCHTSKKLQQFPSDETPQANKRKDNNSKNRIKSHKARQISRKLCGQAEKQGLKKNGKVGDLIVTVSIEISHNLSDDEIKLYEQLKNLSSDNVRKNFGYGS